jgi:hypothetical protein
MRRGEMFLGALADKRPESSESTKQLAARTNRAGAEILFRFFFESNSGCKFSTLLDSSFHYYDTSVDESGGLGRAVRNGVFECDGTQAARRRGFPVLLDPSGTRLNGQKLSLRQPAFLFSFGKAIRSLSPRLFADQGEKNARRSQFQSTNSSRKRRGFWSIEPAGQAAGEFVPRMRIQFVRI